MMILMSIVDDPDERCGETDLPEEGLEPVQGFLQYLHHLEQLF